MKAILLSIAIVWSLLFGLANVVTAPDFPHPTECAGWPPAHVVDALEGR